MHEDVKEAVKHALRVSQYEADPQADTLMTTWERNKKKFIDRFGGLIYECPEVMTFTLNQKAKDDRLKELIEYVSCNCLNPDLGIFIEKNKDTFFDNKVSDTMDTTGISEGMKLVKSFKFFESNKELLTELQNRASQIIQEDKITGKLCFSVHPLDFLTSSENTYNWRSCHSLNGEYRAGNLSYMTDKCTFMVYLKSEHYTYLSAIDQEWNNKKWRMLIYAAENDSIVFAGRQYPFDAAGVLDTVLEEYNKLIPSTFIGEKVSYEQWQNNYLTEYDGKKLSSRFFRYLSGLYSVEEAVVDSPVGLAYNDVAYSSLYTAPYYAKSYGTGAIFGEKFEVYPFQKIEVGGSVTCIHCGNRPVTRRGGHTMRCDQCELEFGGSDNEEIEVCAICGRRMYVEDAYEVDGAGYDVVCYDCFNNECFICDNCDRIFYNCDMNVIRYEDGSIERYCDSCIREKE